MWALKTGKLVEMPEWEKYLTDGAGRALSPRRRRHWMLDLQRELDGARMNRLGVQLLAQRSPASSSGQAGGIGGGGGGGESQAAAAAAAAHDGALPPSSRSALGAASSRRDVAPKRAQTSHGGDRRGIRR